MADLQQIFMQGLMNNAQAKLAPMGGYSGFDPNTLAPIPQGGGRKALNLIGALAAPLANVRSTGIIPALMAAAGGVGQLKNTQDYNKFIQSQYMRGLMDKQGSEQQLGTAYGIVDPRFAGLGKVAGDTMNNLMSHLGNADFGSASTALQSGQMPESYGLAPAAQVAQQTGSVMDRFGKVADNDATMGQLPPWMGAQIPGVGVQAPSIPGGAGMSPIMDTTPQGSLQAGVAQSNLPGQNPFFIGSPDPKTLTDGRQNEQTDRRGNRTINETIRHNQSEEQLKKELQQDQRTGTGYWHKFPPAGPGGGNPLTIPKAAQDYLNNQLEAVDTQLSALGVNTKLTKWNPLSQGLPERTETQAKGGGLFGWGGVSQQDAAKNQQINSLLSQRSQLLQQISGGPFGGRAQQNLQQAGTAVQGTKGSYSF